MKKSFIALAIVIIFAVNGVHSEGATYGNRSPNDELLHLEIVTRKFKIINGRISEDYLFPPEDRPEALQGTFRISYIKVTDQWDNESFVELLNGGPGAGTVTLHLEAKLLKGFSFLIEIYGYKNTTNIR